MKHILVYMTAANRAEARRIGAALVEKRLVACVNLGGPIESLYWWKGKLERGRETALIAKTRAALLPALTTEVRRLHSYENPCVVAFELVGGSAPFLKWITAETAPVSSRAARRARRP